MKIIVFIVVCFMFSCGKSSEMIEKKDEIDLIKLEYSVTVDGLKSELKFERLEHAATKVDLVRVQKLLKKWQKEYNEVHEYWINCMRDKK